MSLSIILGIDIILQGTFRCDETNISLSGLPTPDIFIYCINTCDDVPEVDLMHIIGKTCHNEVATLIQNYLPTKIKWFKNVCCINWRSTNIYDGYP